MFKQKRNVCQPTMQYKFTSKKEQYELPHSQIAMLKRAGWTSDWIIEAIFTILFLLYFYTRKELHRIESLFYYKIDRLTIRPLLVQEYAKHHCIFETRLQGFQWLLFLHRAISSILVKHILLKLSLELLTFRLHT